MPALDGPSHPSPIPLLPAGIYEYDPGQEGTHRRASLPVRLEPLESRQLLAVLLGDERRRLRPRLAPPGDPRQRRRRRGVNTISFAIPAPASTRSRRPRRSPAINNPAILDATTQPGYAGYPADRAERGQHLRSRASRPRPRRGVNGLVLSGGSSTVQGLTIDRFTGYGIRADARRQHGRGELSRDRPDRDPAAGQRVRRDRGPLAEQHDRRAPTRPAPT